MEPTTEKTIREMLEVAKAHSLAEMAYQENGLRVAFRRGVKRAAPPAKAEASSNGQSATPASGVSEGEIVRSPIVGTFRRSNSKDHPPLMVEGNHVKPGERLGVVECMKIPNEVVSTAGGVITKILVEDGQVVEYGQPLFIISTKNESANGTEEK